MEKGRTKKVNPESKWEDITDQYQSQYEDVTDSYQPTQTQEETNAPEPSFMSKLLGGVGETGLGIAKGLGNEAMNIGGMLRDIPGVGSVLEAISPDPLAGISRAGRPGAYPEDYSMFNREGRNITGMAPQGRAQNVGSGAAEIATFMLPAGIEARAATAAGRALRGMYPVLRSAMGARGAQAALRGGGIAAKAGIGAASGAGASAVTDSDVGEGALFGGGVPAAFSVLRGPLKTLGQKLHESALGSMGRALSVNFLNRGREFVENKILQPLLDRGEMFGSLRSLENRMRTSANQAMRQRDAIRAQYPADYSIPIGEVEDALSRAREQFSRIDVGAGQTMPGGKRDIAKRSFIEQELQPDVWKSSRPALAAAKDVSGREMVNQGLLPGMKGQSVLFDTLQNFKQNWSDFAREHGKYQGKKIVGQIPTSTVEVEAKYEAANEVRELLRKHMPGEWDALNRKYHIDTQIADLAEQRSMARMGDPALMAETVLGEVPSKYPGRAMARSYMKAIRSPAWNSAVANLKEQVGKKLKTAQGFNMGQALAFLDSMFTKPDISVEASPEVAPPTEDLTPFLAPSERKRMRWNQETGTFEEVQ